DLGIRAATDARTAGETGPCKLSATKCAQWALDRPLLHRRRRRHDACSHRGARVQRRAGIAGGPRVLRTQQSQHARCDRKTILAKVRALCRGIAELRTGVAAVDPLLSPLLATSHEAIPWTASTSRTNRSSTVI